MKLTSTLYLLLLTLPGFSQQSSPTSMSKNPLESEPAVLAKNLVSGCVSDKEKVTSIFKWITDNIAYYRPDARKAKKKNDFMHLSSEDDTPGNLPSLTERVAAKVLRDKRAVCDGYARLFKSLCDHAGLTSQIITGYARTRYEIAGKGFRSNHTWNAVKIEGSWYLLDVTWASGYLLRSTDEFVRQYDDYYFLTTPEKFIEHHYPDDPKWALMENPPIIPEFKYTPFRQKSFSKYAITSYFPLKGTIETRIGDTINLELETIAAQRNMSIAGDSLWEADSRIESVHMRRIKRNSQCRFYSLK